MRSSIFSSRRLPWASLAAVGLVGLTSVTVERLVGSGILAATPYRGEYLQRLMEAREVTTSLMTMGHSMAEGIFPRMAQPVSPTRDPEGSETHELEVFQMVLSRSMPRTDLFILDAVKFQCIRPGGKALFYLTPTAFNRNSRGFWRTIATFFSWKEFREELLANVRVDDIRFFLTDCSVPLIRYRPELRAWLSHGIDWLARPGGHPGEVRITEEERSRPGGPFTQRLLELDARDYQLDRYQMGALSKIIQGLRQQQVDVVVVLFPCPPSHRLFVGEENIARFVEAAHGLAADHEVPVLDYVSGATGLEYEYSDGTHFTSSAKQAFTDLLTSDVQSLFAPAES